MATAHSRSLTVGQRAYEAKRAAKAGVSLDQWLAEKDKQAAEQARAEARAARTTAKPSKPPGFFRRLLERAHKPL
jgi:hypothetical protein